ncbi:MAG: T9SS type A sorting domain-containing protein [Janthinobacterium lividum]
MPRLLALSFFLALATGGLASGFAPPALPLPSAAQRTALQQARPSTDDKTLVVYPNPSTGIVHLTINGQEGRRVELQVLNVIGSVIYHETMTDLNDRATKVLDLSRFANGLYYVKLEGSGANQMCKLVIR